MCASVWYLLAVGEFVSDCGEVHGFPDHLTISRDRFGIDGSQKRPGVLMALQLGQENSDEQKERRFYIQKLQTTSKTVMRYLQMVTSLLLSLAVTGFFTHAGLSCSTGPADGSSVFLFFISFVALLGELPARPDSSSEVSPVADAFPLRLASLTFFGSSLERFKGFLLFRERLFACTEPNTVY